MLVRASFARRNRYATQASFSYKEVLDFALCELCTEGFYKLFFFYIQISSILESQFNVNRHFAFSGVDARD